MFDASELNTLSADLTTVARLAPRKASQAVRKTAGDIEATSKTFVPVDTGNLKNSIGSGPIGEDRGLKPGDLTAEIGPTADYGEYVEDGTSQHGPAAYMGPAFDRHAHQLEAALTQLAGEVL